MIASCASCISVDSQLGRGFLATDRQYDYYTADIPLEDIRMEEPDSLSGYSIYRFTVGALRDETFGLTTRSTAFTLVPVADSLDFGIPGTQQFKSFHFAAVSDSVSCSDPAERFILQNVRVYALASPITAKASYPKVYPDRDGGVITLGTPVYDGTDSLSFNFTKAFGEHYMTITKDDLDESLEKYVKKFPGIYIEMDEPAGNGGRINMFKVPVDVYESYILGSYASLKFSAMYEGKKERTDTSFMFYIGPLKHYKTAGVSSTSTSSYPQVAFNMSSGDATLKGKSATDKFYLEGGRGVKPVIKAASLREKILEEISKHGSTEGIVVGKASLILPCEFPDDYTLLDYFPAMASPTSRVVTTKDGVKTVSYGSLTDSSTSDENQGDINLSLSRYAPDITHHIQSLIGMKADADPANYDIWFLAMANEEMIERSSSSTSEYDQYLQQLAYASYYNNLYNGYGYGGYGYGYGSYGYGYDSYYNNYYNYMMLSQLYASNDSSSESVSVQTMLDTHRYYRAVFYGPEATDVKKRPRLRITYSLPKSSQ